MYLLLLEFFLEVLAGTGLILGLLISASIYVNIVKVPIKGAYYFSFKIFFSGQE